MRVLLVNIYFNSTRVRYMSSSYVLKAYYQSNGAHNGDVSIEVRNYSTAGNAEDIASDIAGSGADFIGFSCYIWNIHLVELVLRQLRGAGHQAAFAMGGPEISEEYARSDKMRALADYFMVGEGELSFTQLLDMLASGATGPLPEGVVHYDKAAQAYRYTPQSQRVDLSRVPSIYMTDTIPLELYKGELVFLETQRGCKYKCQYCLYHKNLSGITCRAIEDVRREITFLMTRRDISSIRFVDPTFSANLDYAKKILRCFVDLKKQGHQVKKIMIEYEYHDIDEEYISLIAQLKTRTDIRNYAKAGLTENKPISDGFEIVDGYTVFNGVGIQSFCNDALRAVSRRPIYEEEIDYFFDVAKKYNIMLKLDMILGLPRETRETYLAGLDRLMGYIKDTDHHFQPAVLMVLPGSTLEKRSRQAGLCYDERSSTVYRTREMDEADMLYCAQITGMVHRMLNSPLRIPFYRDAERSGMSYIDFAIAVFDHLNATLPTGENIFKNGAVTKLYDYVGNDLFGALKQKDLLNAMGTISKET